MCSAITVTVVQPFATCKSSQNCYINSQFMEQNFSKLAFVPSTDETDILCRLMNDCTLSSNFCRLGINVIDISKVELNCRGLPCKKLNLEFLPQTINSNTIKIIERAVTNIKSAKVAVVFESLENARLWSQKMQYISEVVLSLMELNSYIVSEKCIVLCKNLDPVINYGIYCLVIQCSSKLSGGCGRFTCKTKLDITCIISRHEYDQYQDYGEGSSLSGLEKQYNELKEIIEQRLAYVSTKEPRGISPSNKVMLAGPSGCGKTTLVKQVCAACQIPLFTIMGGMLSDSSPGESEAKLRDAFKNTSLLLNGALLLDQLDSICPRRTDTTPAHVARLTTQLLSLLESPSGPALIFATTSHPDAIEPSARRPGRLDREIFIGPPTQAERKDILKSLWKDLNPPNLDALAVEGSRLTPGYVAADLLLLARETALNVSTTDKTQSSWESELRTAVAKMKPASLRSGFGIVTTEPISLNQLGGLDDIKLKLQIAIQWPLSHPEAFSKLGIPRPKGVLLYGPPGCAKTSLVRAIASASGTTFFAVSAAELYTSTVGTTERKLVGLFHRGRCSSPAVIFIDEIDALVGSRGDGNERTSGVQERVLSTLLVELDGTAVPSSGGGVMVVAATNRPDLLDAALLRPGRFDKHIFVPAPDETTRYAILQTVTSTMPLDSDVDLKLIAQNTNLYSGADLQNLCREAALYALTRTDMSAQAIKQEHFLHVLSNSNPSLSEKDLDWYSNFQAGL